MSGGSGFSAEALGRAGAMVRRAAMLLVPAGRRDWVEAVWAEAPEVPPGLGRLAWRAGGVRLIARETGMMRRIGGLLLFAAAAALAARAAWPGSPATVFTPDARADVITIGVLLAGLPVLARWLLGPPGSRPARWLRVGCYAALVAVLPAVNRVEQFSYTPPRGSADLRVYLLVANPAHHSVAGANILVLVITGLYLAAVLWITSQRSGIASATLAAGAVAGIAFGLVMYAVAPLGLSKEATNPWLPGSDIDPLMLLAWLLLLGGPVAAAVAADRRYTAASSTPPTAGARMRQMITAGLLTSMTGATFSTVAGFGTTLAMVKAAWLRDWLYHGSHLLYGVQNLSADVKTPSAIAYSHQITGAMDTGVFFGMLIIFPLITLATTGLVAAVRAQDDTAAPGDTRPGGGGPPGGAGPAPEPPESGRPAVTGDLPGLHEPAPVIEQDRLVAGRL